MGYEFSPEVKKLARNRAGGKCEFPAYTCYSPNNARVGHLTGIADGKARGVVRESITHIDNTIVQCERHDRDLDEQQALLLLKERNRSVWLNPFAIDFQVWRNRR